MEAQIMNVTLYTNVIYTSVYYDNKKYTSEN